ncbi:MAG TPA: hypothetical protein EYP53_03240 [Candidatus Latescibacteria bacterium]|nr:hypothetical protein [Candidatus Latescibacterota bacterium]
MRRQMFTVIAITVLFMPLLWLIGCAEGPTGVEEVTEEERALARTRVTDAENHLVNAVAIAMGEEELPDFTAANAAYKEALTLDPGNLQANFGAAVTEILSLLNDPDIRTVIDSLEAWTESGVFPMSPRYGEGASRVGQAKAVRSLPRLLFKTANTALSNPPLVHEVQEIIETELVPRIDYALERLAILEGHPDFQYLLPPRMTAQPDTMEVDLGEVYLLDASLNILRVVANLVTAYNLDFDKDGSYEYLEDEIAAARHFKYLIEDSPTFLTLRPGNRMREVKSGLLTALDKAEGCLAFIRAETDPQDDDVIKVEMIAMMDEQIVPGDPEAPNFARAFDRPEDIIAELKKILSGPYTLTEDFDGDETTPDVPIIVDIAHILDNPVQDLRTLLPYHAWLPEEQWGMVEGPPIYFTDEKGNPLDMMAEDFFPVFPDYTFGGLLPGMTREKFEALIRWAFPEEEGFEKPVAGPPIALSFMIFG